MSPDLNPEEEELIAFHLGEPCDHVAIRERLLRDEAYALLSESVSRTLRVYSAEPVAPPDTEAAWRKLRPNLPALEVPEKGSVWRWFVLAPAALAMLLVGLFLVGMLHRSPKIEEANVIKLQQPVEPVNAPNVSQHLDRAERWLTTVNHAPAALDGTTRAEGERLLMTNAAYLSEAHDHGDLPDAVALERLGRVLTTANHATSSGLELRVEMNTEGLLLDLRILRQNHQYHPGEPQ